MSGPGLQSRARCHEAKRAAGSQTGTQRLAAQPFFLSYPAVLGLNSVVCDSPGWVGDKQATVTSLWNPGFNWPNTSPRREKSTAFTQARESSGPGGTGYKN